MENMKKKSLLIILVLFPMHTTGVHQEFSNEGKLRLLMRGLKYGLQGTITAKNLGG